MSFQKDLEIFLLVQPNLQVIYLQIYLPPSAEEIKYFGVILPMRRDSYALLAARHARGEFFFDTMHVK